MTHKYICIYIERERERETPTQWVAGKTETRGVLIRIPVICTGAFRWTGIAYERFNPIQQSIKNSSQNAFHSTGITSERFSPIRKSSNKKLTKFA